MNLERASVRPLSAISTLAFSALIWELPALAISKASCKEIGAEWAATNPPIMHKTIRFIATQKIQKL
jgi:hypothetical protein